MTKIEIAIREWFRPAFGSEEELDTYIKNTIFTIDFGEQDVIENRNLKPVIVKKDGMRIQTKFKNGISGICIKV
jgi:hypothetical protein